MKQKPVVYLVAATCHIHEIMDLLKISLISEKITLCIFLDVEMLSNFLKNTQIKNNSCILLPHSVVSDAKIAIQGMDFAEYYISDTDSNKIFTDGDCWVTPQRVIKSVLKLY